MATPGTSAMSTAATAETTVKDDVDVDRKACPAGAARYAAVCHTEKRGSQGGNFVISPANAFQYQLETCLKSNMKY